MDSVIYNTFKGYCCLQLNTKKCRNDKKITDKTEYSPLICALGMPTATKKKPKQNPRFSYQNKIFVSLVACTTHEKGTLQNK